jgi:hypothetical protein
LPNSKNQEKIQAQFKLLSMEARKKNSGSKKMTNAAIVSQALLTRHAKARKSDGDTGCSKQLANAEKARATRIMGEQILLSHSFLC